MAQAYFPVSWYRSEDYDRARAMMDDANNFPASFEDWLQLANDQIAKFAAQGVVVEKIILDPEEFRAFCAGQKIKPDQQARMSYAVAKLMRQERHEA